MTSRSRKWKQELVGRQLLRVALLKKWGGFIPMSFDYMRGYEKRSIQAMMCKPEIGRYESMRLYMG